jgi:hypothetical protein
VLQPLLQRLEHESVLEMIDFAHRHCPCPRLRAHRQLMRACIMHACIHRTDTRAHQDRRCRPCSQLSSAVGNHNIHVTSSHSCDDVTSAKNKMRLIHTAARALRVARPHSTGWRGPKSVRYPAMLRAMSLQTRQGSSAAAADAARQLSIGRFDWPSGWIRREREWERMDSDTQLLWRVLGWTGLTAVNSLPASPCEKRCVTRLQTMPQRKHNLRHVALPAPPENFITCSYLILLLSHSSLPCLQRRPGSRASARRS